MNAILHDVSAPALTNAIEANLFAFYSGCCGWPPAVVYDDEDLLWTMTDIPNSNFNSILRARLASDQVDAAIDAAITRSKSRGVPVCWWVGPVTRPKDLGARLEAHGFTRQEDEPGMAVDLEALDEDVTPLPGLTIGQVNEISGLEPWSQAFATGFGVSNVSLNAFFDLYRWMSFEAHLPLYHYVAWLNGKPVATSSVLYRAGVAGIYNVSVVPEARHKGIGTMITFAPLREARTRGYRIAILQASEMGASVYRRLGFKEYCKIAFYEWSPGQ